MEIKSKILFTIGIFITFNIFSQNVISPEILHKNIDKSEIIDSELYINILTFFKEDEKNDFVSNR